MVHVFLTAIYPAALLVCDARPQASSIHDEIIQRMAVARLALEPLSFIDDDAPELLLHFPLREILGHLLLRHLQKFRRNLFGAMRLLKRPIQEMNISGTVAI